AGKALLRNNMPLLAYIAGKAAAFTGKDHNFAPSESVDKQLIVINNSRRTVECDWSVALERFRSEGRLRIATGDQMRTPLHFELPSDLAPGRYRINATVHFDVGEMQTDEFSIKVMPRPSAISATSRIAVFDPKGETRERLAALGVPCHQVDAEAK